MQRFGDPARDTPCTPAGTNPCPATGRRPLAIVPPADEPPRPVSPDPIGALSPAMPHHGLPLPSTAESVTHIPSPLGRATVLSPIRQRADLPPIRDCPLPTCGSSTSPTLPTAPRIDQLHALAPPDPSRQPSPQPRDGPASADPVSLTRPSPSLSPRTSDRPPQRSATKDRLRRPIRDMPAHSPPEANKDIHDSHDAPAPTAEDSENICVVGNRSPGPTPQPQPPKPASDGEDPLKGLDPLPSVGLSDALRTSPPVPPHRHQTPSQDSAEEPARTAGSPAAAPERLPDTLLFPTGGDEGEEEEPDDREESPESPLIPGGAVPSSRSTHPRQSWFGRMPRSWRPWLGGGNSDGASPRPAASATSDGSALSAVRQPVDGPLLARAAVAAAGGGGRLSAADAGGIEMASTSINPLHEYGSATSTLFEGSSAAAEGGPPPAAHASSAGWSSSAKSAAASTNASSRSMEPGLHPGARRASAAPSEITSEAPSDAGSHALGSESSRVTAASGRLQPRPAPAHLARGRPSLRPLHPALAAETSAVSGVSSAMSSAMLSERSSAAGGTGRIARGPLDARSGSVKGEESKASVGGGAYVGYVAGSLGSVVLEVDEEVEEETPAVHGGKTDISTKLLLAHGGDGGAGDSSSSGPLSSGDPTLKSLKYAPLLAARAAASPPALCCPVGFMICAMDKNNRCLLLKHTHQRME